MNKNDEIVCKDTNVKIAERKDKSLKGEYRELAYVEPADYFPEDIRKKCKIGEYAEDDSVADKKCDGCSPTIVMDDAAFSQEIAESIKRNK